MALLNKLFPAKKKQSFKHSNANISYKPFPFSKEQVRVLLYRECDWRGRKLLFDSTAVHKVPLCEAITSKTKQNFVEVLDGFGYKFLRKNADTMSIGEMIFGAVAMAYRGTSLKVHWLSSPTRLLCTQVFMSPLRTRTLQSASSSSGNRLESISDQSADRSCYSSWESSLNSTGDMLERPQLSSNLESGLCDTYTTISSAMAESSTSDSGYQACSPRSSGNITSRSSLSQSDCSFHTFSSGASSQNSSQRRIVRNISTSFENDLNSRRSSDMFSNKSVDPNKRAKLGLAVCVTLTESVESEMQYFYMEHIPVIESMMNRLQSAVKQAYIEKPVFLSTMIAGFECTAQFIYDLFRGPRIAEPLWTLLGDSQLDSVDYRSVARSFVDRLCRLLNAFDTKGTNFFISTLITGILTHHLGWVTTVASPKQQPQQSEKSGSAGYFYNALWAQLSDLYGANGSPAKLARTIVCGSDTSTLDEILAVVTYFIRCGDVQRTINEPVADQGDLDSVMDRLDEADDLLKSSTACTFHNKHLPTACPTDQTGAAGKLGKTEAYNLGLCEPRCGLGNKDSLFNLRLCSQLHDQTCEYNNKTDDRPNVNADNKASCAVINEASSNQQKNRTILYHLKSNEDQGCENAADVVHQTDYGTNAAENNMKMVKSKEVIRECEAVQESVCQSTEKCADNRFSVSAVPNLRKKNKESYPNLSALITKNSLGYGTSQTSEGSLESLEERTEVLFVLGENEELSGLSKQLSKNDKLIPKVDKEFVRGARTVGDASDRASLCEDCPVIPNISTDFEHVTVDETRLDFRSDSVCERDAADDSSLHVNASLCTDCESVSLNDYRQTSTSTPVVRSSVLIISGSENRTSSDPSSKNANKSFGSSTDVNESDSVKSLKKMIQLPLLKSRVVNNYKLLNPGFATSLFGGVTDHYVPDMVLQGTTSTPERFEAALRSDLALSAHGFAPFDEDVAESVCVLADADRWEVRVVSSHACAFDPAGSVTAMSQLVADMLDAVQQMWRLRTSAEHCIMYIENKLRDVYLKSEALAAMLLTTDFCEASWLTASLGVQVADLPLLMSVASTHTPQLAKRYSLSFR